MSVAKLHERLERIEAAYLAAIAGRKPEDALRSSVWRAEILPKILAAVPDCTVEEQIQMFRWRTRKLSKQWREFQKRPHLWQVPNWPKWLPVPESVDGTAASE